MSIDLNFRMINVGNRRMLKKTGLIIGFCCVMPFSSAFAEGGAGCGLGKLILEGKSGVGANIGASIINGIYGNQLFAMSSGTSGCDTTTMVNNEIEEKATFVALNMDNLSVDVAQGQGNYLTSLAHVMNINEQDRNAFYTLTQRNYEGLFAETNSSEEVLAALNVAMASDNVLSKYAL